MYFYMCTEHLNSLISEMSVCLLPIFLLSCLSWFAKINYVFWTGSYASYMLCKSSLVVCFLMCLWCILKNIYVSGCTRPLVFAWGIFSLCCDFCGIFSCGMHIPSYGMWDLVPQLRIKPGPCIVKHRGLATGKPGKYRSFTFSCSEKWPSIFPP